MAATEKECYEYEIKSLRKKRMSEKYLRSIVKDLAGGGWVDEMAYGMVEDLIKHIRLVDPELFDKIKEYKNG